MKLEYKLSFMLAALMLMAGIVLIIINTQVVKSELEQNLISRERIGMELLEKKLYPYFIDKDYAGMTGAIFEEKGVKKELVEYILVHGPDGNIVAHTFLDSIPDAASLEAAPHEFLVERHTVNNVPVIEMSMAIKDGSYELGHIHVGYKAEYIENTLYYVSLMLAAGIALVIFLTVAFGAFIFKKIIANPIAELEKTIGEISSGNLDKKASINTGDELEGLAKSFNKMTSDLKESKSNIERQVADKTKEVNDKMLELMEAKSAVLNMMDDAEALNRELVAAQEKLNENLKILKETDVKKNEFMSIAAHELKTPMTSIHGFSQLLQNKEIAEDPVKRDKYLQIMDHETTRLARLVNDILDLSRVDLGAATFDITDVDVNAVIEAIKTEMNVQIKNKGLEAEYKVEMRLPKIKTDRERLTQILMNLINNAVKYTPQGKITIVASKEDDRLHFSVNDTGIGISKENQSKIFSRFYQVDSSYTRSAGGVGLGLSLCKEYIELLGGKIWFVSAIGKGSEFHFTLPIKGTLKNNVSKNPKTKEIVN